MTFLDRLARAEGEHIEIRGREVSLATICTAIGTTRPAATTRGKSHLSECAIFHIYEPCTGRVGTAVRRA